MHSIWQQLSGTIFGVALNYKGLLAKNQEKFQQDPYKKAPVKPVLFIKTPNTKNVDQGEVQLCHGHELHPGPALAVIIGKDASRIKAQDAMQYVAGYAVANEFSLPEDSYYRPAIKAKCRDGYFALGSNIVPVGQISDPHQLSIKLLVNGEVKQTNNTSNLVRSIPELIEQISEFMTLHKGDVLITGVPEGRVSVQAGDEVVVEIQSIGKLSNKIIADKGVQV